MDTQRQPDSATISEPLVIGIKEATRLSGKSERTIRRWIREGRLNDLRKPDDRRSPVKINRLELRRILTDMTAPIDRPSISVSASGGGVDSAAVKAMQAHLATLEGTVNDLRAERDRLRGDVSDLRRDLAERDQRIRALEKELNGPHRGLLTRVVNRFGL